MGAWWHWALAALLACSAAIVAARNIHIFVVRPIVGGLHEIRLLLRRIGELVDDVRQLGEDLAVLIRTTLSHEQRIQNLEQGSQLRGERIRQLESELEAVAVRRPPPLGSDRD